RPTGSVVVTIDGRVQPAMTLTTAGGVSEAILTTSVLGPGAHVIQAIYAGDSAFLASASAPATLTITQPTPTSAGPAVTSVQRFGIHMMPTSLMLTFSQPLDASRATDPSNYRIVGPDGKVVAIASASYDAASRSVTLHPAKQIDVHKTYRLTVNGQTASGV